jgi:hypothetical protein
VLHERSFIHVTHLYMNKCVMFPEFSENRLVICNYKQHKCVYYFAMLCKVFHSDTIIRELNYTDISTVCVCVCARARAHVYTEEVSMALPLQHYQN